MKQTLLILIINLAVIGLTMGQDINEVELKSFTRGGQKFIKVTPDSIYFKNRTNLTVHSIDKSEWDTLGKLISGFNLNQMEQFSSSSSDRARDAAWHTNLSIRTSTKNYDSNEFDDTNAPKELEEVVKYLLQLDKKYNTKETRIY